MDIKVNQVNSTTQVDTPQAAEKGDGTFKFTLASHIEEASYRKSSTD